MCSEYLTDSSPKKILFLASNPIDQQPLRLDHEAHEIDEGLRRSNHRSKFRLGQKWAIRPIDLQRAMIDHQPHIVHFCGHGSGKNGIILQDDQGISKFVSTEALAGLFECFSERVECVVLNACYTSEQAGAIAQCGPCVIGMSNAISDQAAVDFALGFYDALGGGMSYTKAFKLARNRIDLEALNQQNIPIFVSGRDCR